MLTTDKDSLTLNISYVHHLLQVQALIEDPTTGVITLHPEVYNMIGKTPPATPSQKIQRVRALVVEYIKLWPTKLASGGRPIRQGPVALTKKLHAFLSKHPKVTDAEILNATGRYLAAKKKDGYQYISCSDYFIDKSGNSILESYLVNPDLGSKDLEPTQAVNQRFI